MLAQIDRKAQEARAQPISPLQSYPSISGSSRKTHARPHPVALTPEQQRKEERAGVAGGRHSPPSRRRGISRRRRRRGIRGGRASSRTSRGAAAQAGEQPQVPLPLKRCLLPSHLRALRRPRSLRSACVRSSSAGRRSTTTAPFNTTQSAQMPAQPQIDAVPLRLAPNRA